MLTCCSPHTRRSKRADDESEGYSIGGDNDEGSLNSEDVADMVMGSDGDEEAPSGNDDDDDEEVHVHVRGRGARVSKAFQSIYFLHEVLTSK
jgi:hypothetical protein